MKGMAALYIAIASCGKTLLCNSLATDTSWCQYLVRGGTIQRLQSSHLQLHSPHLSPPGDVRTFFWGVELDLKGVYHFCVLKLEDEAEVVSPPTLSWLKPTGQPGELVFGAAVPFLAGILSHFLPTDYELPGMEENEDPISQHLNVDSFGTGIRGGGIRVVTD